MIKYFVLWVKTEAVFNEPLPVWWMRPVGTVLGSIDVTKKIFYTYQIPHRYTLHIWLFIDTKTVTALPWDPHIITLIIALDS